MTVLEAVAADAIEEPIATEPDPSGLPLERLEAELCTLAGQIAAATARFLRLLADFDARDGWAGRQVRSCAHWLSWRCGMDLRTAREHVRVARALSRLPQIAEAFERGEVSYSKVRAITRVADADTEADVLDAALSEPAAQVERLVRGLCTARRNRQREQDQRRDSDPPERGEPESRVRWHWDDDGFLVISGRLAPEDGARLLAGLTRAEHARTASADSKDGPAEHPEPECGPAEHPDRPSMDTRPPAELGPGADCCGADAVQ
ncbi:MAG: DUF222 domain-containing protein [Propionibacteriales bacterium]|nr:DUF222 domain-containing protein [Propionibacteriales bacterium]